MQLKPFKDLRSSGFQTKMLETNASLTFKLLKSEGKMVKQILEANGFIQTENHDWNILWGSGGIKNNVYEDLKSY